MIPENKSDSFSFKSVEMIPNFNNLYSPVTLINDFSNHYACLGDSDNTLLNMLNAPSPSLMTDKNPKTSRKLDPRLDLMVSPEQMNLP